MPSELVNKVALSLFSVPPLLHRKTRRRMGATGNLDIDQNITHLHFEIIKVLSEEHTMRVAEIGKTLHVAKAQMTQLINKLVALNMVERHVDPKDRRAINITLTERGRQFMEEAKEAIIIDLQVMLADLNEQELNELYDGLQKIRKIVDKL